ncbi:hypothetical protein [Streptomyces sp. NPDC048172]|uniref:hypothetical protein n=1 Tax=Streptomyces sp. NPDC048172 TaxID=3365505 RepID=UPI00371B2711
MTFAIPRALENAGDAEETAIDVAGAVDATGAAGAADVLEVPVDAGLALLRRRGLRTGPVAYDPVRARVQLLVPRGTAEELPGLLEWLEWGGIELELTARAAYDPREAAVWLRPPEPGCGPGMPETTGRPVDLVRLVSAAATECHRARLGLQPLAFS